MPLAELTQQRQEPLHVVCPGAFPSSRIVAEQAAAQLIDRSAISAECLDVLTCRSLDDVRAVEVGVRVQCSAVVPLDADRALVH